MLSNRLNEVYKLIKEGMVVADIGTDHAYLPCALVTSGKCDKVYACDVAIGPLKQAIKTIETLNLTDKISIVESNGLAKVSDDVNCICICGMGYHTVEMILNNDIDKVLKYQKIIIQINKNTDLLRKWISDHNLLITDETIVYEGNKFYEIIAFSNKYHDTYSEQEISLGYILPNLMNDTYIKYLENKISKYQLINEDSQSIEIKNEIIMINNLLNKQ